MATGARDGGHRAEPSTPQQVDAESVNEQQVNSFSLGGGDASTQSLAGTGFTYRQDWGDRNGQWILNLNWGAIRNDSRVYVSISEFGTSGVRFIGGARYTVHNIAPHTGQISIWVNIENNSPIRLAADYLVINP